MKKTTTFGALLIIAGLASACSGGSAKPDAAARDAGPADAGGDHDAPGSQGGTPILQRPMGDGGYACSVSRNATSHAPKAWTNLSALQVVAGGTVFLARAEWDIAEYYSGHHAFVLSSMGLDGTLAASTRIPVDNADAIDGVASAPQGQGFVLAWAEAQSLRFAAFDGSGAMVGQPTLVTTLDRDTDYPVDVRMAAASSGSGFAIALSLRTDKAREPYALFLDASGARRGPLRRLGTDASNFTPYYEPAPEVIATQDGYAFAWGEFTPNSGRIFFSKTDALGNETVAPTTITSTTGSELHLEGTGFAGGRARLAETKTGFVAAWSESYWGETAPGDFSPSKRAWSVVRLALLDSRGVPTGPNATLRASEDDVDEVEPVLTPFGDALAVAWGRGSHIYVCAGCVPNHRIDFVLIDPTSLSPLSNVVTVTNGGSSGGLLRKQVALTGSSFLTLYDRTFHTSAEPGSAVFTCVR